MQEQGYVGTVYFPLSFSVDLNHSRKYDRILKSQLITPVWAQLRNPSSTLLSVDYYFPPEFRSRFPFCSFLCSQ